jgi:hypothetical protein
VGKKGSLPTKMRKRATSPVLRLGDGRENECRRLTEIGATGQLISTVG